MSQINDLYEEIAPLLGHDHACLVLHRETGRVYVKKCLDIYHREVYRQLEESENIHIPRLYACEEQDQKLCIIEEYIGGFTLMERISGGTFFSEQETIEIALQICDALIHLHELCPPVIHRDIKLSNVMLTDDGTAKLIDYNAARCYLEKAAQDTILLGTADYAAPEQFGFAQTDARTDLYSLGVMMNYMLTGQSCKTALYSGSKSIRKIISRCTSLDPDRRYQTARALAKDLQRCRFAESRQSPRCPRLLPIPGFRSGKLWKMMTAVTGYLMLFLILADLEVKGHETMPFLLLFDRILLGIWFFFVIALICDYANLRAQFPLLRHPNLLVRIAMTAVFSFLGLLLAIFLPEAVLLIISG